jgi:hypothetical protein
MNNVFRNTVSFLKQNLEALIWVAVILYFFVSPVHTDSHFTICPLSLAGFEYCPGCGLGRSMILLLHGHILESLRMHPLSIFALAILTARIIIVFRNYEKRQKQLNTLNNQSDEEAEIRVNSSTENRSRI